MAGHRWLWVAQLQAGCMHRGQLLRRSPQTGATGPGMA